MKLLVPNFEGYQLSEHMQYHLDNGYNLTETIFRIGSEAYADLFCEARYLWGIGCLEVNEDDQFLLERLKTGQRAIFQGESVVLDSPKRNTKNPKKKFIVYTDSGRKNKDGKIVAKKIEWGDPKLEVRNCDDKARKSFLARHKCSQKNDKKTPGWWACNVHRFAKQLDLTCTKPW